MLKRILTSLTCLVGSAWSGSSTAQEHEDINAANNPLTPKTTINLLDCYLPELEGLDDRYANQFLLRGLIPSELFGSVPRPHSNSGTSTY